MSEGTGGFLHPEQIIEQLDIQSGAKVADFGCGRGYFAIPMAKKVGEDGIVYGLDVLPSALEALQSQAEIDELSNVRGVHCNLETPNGAKLDDESLDLVLLANILFQSQKKIEIIKESKRALKSTGQLVIVDWIKGGDLTPKEGWFLSKEEAQSLSEAEGFIFDRELIMDSQHYGLVFKK